MVSYSNVVSMSIRLVTGARHRAYRSKFGI